MEHKSKIKNVLNKHLKKVVSRGKDKLTVVSLFLKRQNHLTLDTWTRIERIKQLTSLIRGQRIYEHLSKYEQILKSAQKKRAAWWMSKFYSQIGLVNHSNYNIKNTYSYINKNNVKNTYSYINKNNFNNNTPKAFKVINNLNVLNKKASIISQVQKQHDYYEKYIKQIIPNSDQNNYNSIYSIKNKMLHRSYFAGSKMQYIKHGFLGWNIDKKVGSTWHVSKQYKRSNSSELRKMLCVTNSVKNKSIISNILLKKKFCNRTNFCLKTLLVDKIKVTELLNTYNYQRINSDEFKITKSSKMNSNLTNIYNTISPVSIDNKFYKKNKIVSGVSALQKHQKFYDRLQSHVKMTFTHTDKSMTTPKLDDHSIEELKNNITETVITNVTHTIDKEIKRKLSSKSDLTRNLSERVFSELHDRLVLEQERLT